MSYRGQRLDWLCKFLGRRGWTKEQNYKGGYWYDENYRNPWKFYHKWWNRFVAWYYRLIPWYSNYEGLPNWSPWWGFSHNQFGSFFCWLRTMLFGLHGGWQHGQYIGLIWNKKQTWGLFRHSKMSCASGKPPPRGITFLWKIEK